MSRCSTCDLAHLPLCSGMQDPAQCVPAMRGRRHQASLFLSSVHHGWPSTHKPAVPEPPATRIVATLGYRRGKPVVPLGVRQRPD